MPKAKDLVYTLEDVTDAINSIASEINTNPVNDHGYTVGDTLYEMSWKLETSLERIAVALEKIVTRMPIQE